MRKVSMLLEINLNQIDPLRRLDLYHLAQRLELEAIRIQSMIGSQRGSTVDLTSICEIT